MFTRLAVLAGVITLLGACSSEPTIEPGMDEQTRQNLQAMLQGERLYTEIPQDWLKVRDSKTANLHVAEYVPPDTVDTWVEKLSVEAMSGAGLPDPLTFIEGWAMDQSQLCEQFTDNPVFAGFENGYPTVVRLLQCGLNKRTQKPIITMVKAIKGNRSFYTITRIWRLPAPSEADIAAQRLPMDEAAIAAWSDVLRRTTVCDAASTEHPCDKVEDQPQN